MPQSKRRSLFTGNAVCSVAVERRGGDSIRGLVGEETGIDRHGRSYAPTPTETNVGSIRDPCARTEPTSETEDRVNTGERRFRQRRSDRTSRTARTLAVANRLPPSNGRYRSTVVADRATLIEGGPRSASSRPRAGTFLSRTLNHLMADNTYERVNSTGLRGRAPQPIEAETRGGPPSRSAFHRKPGVSPT